MNLTLFVNFRFHYRCYDTRERRLHANSAPDARRQRLAPVGFFSRQIERGEKARLVSKHRPTEVHRILAGLSRQFVHKAFNRKHVVVGTDAAPEPGRYRRRFGPDKLDVQVGDVVGDVDRAIDAVDVDAILEPRRKPARHDRRAADLVLPADDFAVGQGRGDGVAIDRTKNIMLDVFFAGPHDLDGAIDLLGYAHGRDHHVGLELAAKTAAEQVVVDDYLLDRQPRRLRRLRLHAGHDLRAGPDLASIGRDVNRGVDRFHRRVREKRQFVSRLQPVAGGEAFLDIAYGLGVPAVLFAGRAQIPPDVVRTDASVRAFVPVDHERIDAFLGRPHMIADHRDHVIEHHNLAHARDFSGGAVVNLGNLAAEHRTGLEGCE